MSPKRMARPELPVAVLPNGRPVWAEDLPMFGHKAQALGGLLIVLAFLVLLALAGLTDAPHV